MTPVNYSQLFRLVLPQTTVVVTALLVLVVDLLLLHGKPARIRLLSYATLATVGCAISAYFIVSATNHASIPDGMLVTTPLTGLVQIVLLLLAVLTLWISVDSSFTDHVGEYVLLILFATVGMMFLVSTQNLLILFISLELLSLSLYILTAFRKSSARSAEAALKYFLFGGMSAAFLLFGMSLLYGLSGTTNLVRIADAIKAPSPDPLALVAIVMTVAGLGFKVAAAPFHLWAPDAYEGAPTQSAAFIASSSKVASFFVFAQIMLIGFAGAEGNAGWSTYRPGWVPVIMLVAAASIILGNLAAIVQTSVRRLLAYSAVGHAGYMLLGILAHTRQGVTALLYYVVTYALTTLGAFAVVSVVEDKCGGDNLADFAGLSKRAPLLSLCMLIFLLSLAGVPPLAGFFAKFYLFAAAFYSGLLWLVVLAIAMSAVSLYYYLQVLKRIYVADAPPDSVAIRVPLVTQSVVCLLAIAVITLGCAPDLLLQWLPFAVTLR
jgi:NADH-quinone oxidoreductase subunit N